jgi:hypothetical protein
MYMGDSGLEAKRLEVTVVRVAATTGLVLAFSTANGFFSIIPPAAKRHVVNRMVVFIFQ